MNAQDTLTASAGREGFEPVRNYAKNQLTEQLAAVSSAREFFAGVSLDVPKDLLDTWDRIESESSSLYDVTVVVLAGPTGAGKSSLFNNLTSSKNAKVGLLRPTTDNPISAATAQTSIADSALSALTLDHCVVPAGSFPKGMSNHLIIVDLPDFDSVKLENRKRAQEIQSLADAIVWVVDPQKYADALLHNEYLVQPRFRGRSNIVAITYSDVLLEEEKIAIREDLRSILAENTLEQIPIFLLSNRDVNSIEPLADHLAQLSEEKVAGLHKLIAQMEHTGKELAQVFALRCIEGSKEKEWESKWDSHTLTVDACQAVGVDAICQAAERYYRRQASKSISWPLFVPLRALRPDPFKRLRFEEESENKLSNVEACAKDKKADESLPLNKDSKDSKDNTDNSDSLNKENTSKESSSDLFSIFTKSGEQFTHMNNLPQMSFANRVLLTRSCQQYAKQLSQPLDDQWGRRLSARSGQLCSALEQALQKTLETTLLPAISGRWWWILLRVINWMFLAVGAVGLLWIILTHFAKLVHINMPVPTIDAWQVISWPLFMLIIGLGGAVLWSVFARTLTRRGARRYRVAVNRALENVIKATTEQAFTDPLRELAVAHQKLVALALKLGHKICR